MPDEEAKRQATAQFLQQQKMQQQYLAMQAQQLNSSILSDTSLLGYAYWEPRTLLRKCKDEFCNTECRPRDEHYPYCSFDCKQWNYDLYGDVDNDSR